MYTDRSLIKLIATKSKLWWLHIIIKDSNLKKLFLSVQLLLNVLVWMDNVKTPAETQKKNIKPLI